MAIGYAVDGDGSVLVVTLTGRLGLTDVAPLHRRLLKCLAEQPQGLLFDLTGLDVEEPLALAFLTAVSRQAARWPGTPLLLCGPPPATREMLTAAAHRRLPVFASVEDARAHIGSGNGTLPTLREDLLPVTGAARHARDVITDACLRWEIPELISPASHVATEMVANVVDHANTMMTLQLSLRSRYLNIAVRDGSRAEPTPLALMPTEARKGRGLLLIAAIAHSWGWIPTGDGKVVWAALRRP